MATILTLVVCIWLVRQWHRNRVSSRPPPPSAEVGPVVKAAAGTLWTAHVKGIKTPVVVGPFQTEGEAVRELTRLRIDGRKIKTLTRGA